MNVQHFLDKAELAKQEAEYVEGLKNKFDYCRDRYIILLALTNWKLTKYELKPEHRIPLIKMFEQSVIVTATTHYIQEERKASTDDIYGVYNGDFNSQILIASLSDFEDFLNEINN